jgi:hypothetical protein
MLARLVAVSIACACVLPNAAGANENLLQSRIKAVKQVSRQQQTLHPNPSQRFDVQDMIQRSSSGSRRTASPAAGEVSLSCAGQINRHLML